MTSSFPAYSGPRITVHWCPANVSHRLHQIVGARGGAGWYVFFVDGCLGRVIGPFTNRAEAQRFADRF